MGTDKRARQKAGRQARIEAAEEEAAKRQQRSKILRFLILAFVIVAVLGIFRVATGGDEEPASSPDTTAAPGDQTTPTTAGGVPGRTLTGDTPCPTAENTGERVGTFEKAPPMCIDTNKVYVAKMSTSKGDMTLELDPKLGPKTVNNFVVLSKYKFFDGITFHRIIPDFVIQGGNPGPGDAGPGYAFEDELPASKDVYQPGALAMANSGKDTNGSQFFIVLSPGRLEPKYSYFGKVTEAFETTAQAIAKTGTSAGTPSEPTIINSVTVTEKDAAGVPPSTTVGTAPGTTTATVG